MRIMEIQKDQPDGSVVAILKEGATCLGRQKLFQRYTKVKQVVHLASTLESRRRSMMDKILGR